jgi:hypothetical protein
MLGFPWFYSLESGLFNGLQRIQIKKISPVSHCVSNVSRHPFLLAKRPPRAHGIQARSPPRPEAPRVGGAQGMLQLAPRSRAATAAAHSMISPVGATSYRRGRSEERLFDDGLCPPLTQGVPQPAGHGGRVLYAHFFYRNAQALSAVIHLMEAYSTHFRHRKEIAVFAILPAGRFCPAGPIALVGANRRMHAIQAELFHEVMLARHICLGVIHRPLQAAACPDCRLLCALAVVRPGPETFRWRSLTPARRAGRQGARAAPPSSRAWPSSPDRAEVGARAPQNQG